ncbi:MAG TPA: AraC family transcriptional regulator [Xanthobacteraceae bacterium]|nr:AraC family transcriptional regulator [Xanthobacteraceae bacterium]
MAAIAHPLAAGAGWRVDDVVCTSGPCDTPFEEQHTGVCIATVTGGTFQYRTSPGMAVLAPGAVLLGNDGQCFECGHEHGTGDRCVSFHFTPEFIEAVAATVPGVTTTAFTAPSLPPSPALMPLVAAAEHARGDADAAEFEEFAVRALGMVLAAAAGKGPARRRPNRRDERRVTDALRRIEACAHEPLSLAGLAREAAMSPYHFLRIFRDVVGMTPHQYLLRTRLHRAAVRLRDSGDSVSTIAYDAGFNDLSTFNRRFQRVMGTSPGAYRAVSGTGLVAAGERS